MDIKEVQQSWDSFGKTDPMWAILTYADKLGNQWEPKAFFETGVQEIDSILQYVGSLKIPQTRKRALDFGCGIGRLTQALAHHFEQVDGVDIAPSMLEMARQYNASPDSCQYHLNAQDDLKLFPDNHFDFICSLITLQHMETRYSKNYLQEFLRVLAPQGLLLFQLPSEQTKSYRIRQRLKRFLPNTLLYRYRKARYGDYHAEQPEHQALIRFMQENGGRVVDVREDQSAGNWISFRYCVSKP